MSILDEELNFKTEEKVLENNKAEKRDGKIKTKDMTRGINKRERIKEIGDKVKQIPISNIILSRLDHNPDGSCCCPFHNDKTTGSFHYDDKKNYFKCFSCNTRGDGINFIEKLEGKEYLPAVMELAGEYGIISKEEYKQLTGNDFDKTVKDFKPVVLLDKSDKERSQPEITNCFFEEIRKNATLSDEHRQYLLGRGLTEKDIEEVGYFTIPVDKTNLENAINTPVFTEQVRKTFESVNVLNKNAVYDPEKVRVPGIFIDKRGNYKMTMQVGLGIPIRDADGNIQAIQIRRDKVKPGEIRYLWWTSNKMDGGATPGCPVDVQIPRRKDGKPGIRNHCVLLSEGHFKARVLAKDRKSVSISIQGVQNIKELDGQLRSLFEKNDLRFNRVKIFYDMDIYKNKNIFTALEKLYEDLCGPEVYKSIALDRCYNKNGEMEMFPLPFEDYDVKREVEIELWDPKVGKGADDYIENGGKNFKVMDCSEFLKIYSEKFMTSKEFKDMEKYREQYNEIITQKRKGNEQEILKKLIESEEKCEDLFCNLFSLRK